MRTVKIGETNRRNGKPAWLRRNAGKSYLRMARSSLPSGCISDAGRTNAEQWEMWRLYKAGKLKATAAYPGTSLHESGLAIDVAEPARKWVRKYGKFYGWVKDSVPNEPWHMTYVPSLDRAKPKRVKATRVLDAATCRAISRAVGRPRINKPLPKGQRAFWRHVQRHINAIMRGTEGWTPLKIDGRDGPKTWEGLRLSLRKTNTLYRPAKYASKERIIYCWQHGLNAGKRKGWSQKNTLRSK